MGFGRGTLLDWLDGPRAGRNLCVRAPDWVIDEALKRASDMMSERAVGTSTISGLPGGPELRFLENAIGAIMRVQPMSRLWNVMTRTSF